MLTSSLTRVNGPRRTYKKTPQTPLSPRWPLEIQCCVDVKYAEADTDSVESDAGGPLECDAGRQNLARGHGKTPASNF